MDKYDLVLIQVEGKDQALHGKHAAQSSRAIPLRGGHGQAVHGVVCMTISGEGTVTDCARCGVHGYLQGEIT